MAGRVREDVQGLAAVVSAIKEHLRAEFFCPLAMTLQVFHGGDGEVHVHLHRHVLGGPG